MKKITRSVVARLLPGRAQHAHKGDFGRVLVVAGSRRMCGAGLLCAKSALLAGAGLVYWALPKSMQPSFAAALPEVITLPLPETKTGEIAQSAWPTLKDFITQHKPTVLAVGPGMGNSPLLPVLLRQANIPLVVDADALNTVARLQLFSYQKPVVFTPHPGEMARLLKMDVAVAEKSRVAQVTRLAQQTHHVCVLKGHQTLVALSHGIQTDIWQNTTGGPALAKAGSGDVLAGLIAGLWAQQGAKDARSAFQMAACAVYLHGLAGDLAAAESSSYSVLACDVAAQVGKAFSQVTKEEHIL
ncbi:MAG: NAD(P)H-hydrate dehydratase [Elusimicrobiaceae bacterium]|nr:NAD(P)H-hydrate dehydratase [Elusimicrobiaceae bacterium]